VARRYTDEVKGLINTLLPNNSAGAISPEDVRSVLTDIIDSLRPAWAAIRAEHSAAPEAFATTNQWQTVLSPTMWTTGGNSDPLEFLASPPIGALVVKYAYFNHVLRANLNFEGAVNVEYQFSIAANGIPLGGLSSVDGAGNGRIVQASDWALAWDAADTQYSVMVRSPSGNSTIHIHQIDLYGELATTRYP